VISSTHCSNADRIARTSEGVQRCRSTAPDGAQTFYKDWGTGQPVIFSHGWPLSADAWDAEMKLVADHGFRAIAHDRRGHGRSS